MKRNIFYLLLVVLVVISCNSKKNEYNPYNVKEFFGKVAFEVDFKKTTSNLKTIHVKLNNANGYDAIFDTGCSGMSISALELTNLIKSGTITSSDYVGDEYSTIADGSSVKIPVYNIREVDLIDKNGKVHSVRDIKATVMENIAADILIGSSVIDNFAKKSYTVDLSKKVISFQ